MRLSLVSGIFMPQANTGQLRIIGGQWRSRRLPVLEQPGLRPTPDRVRETLFNWLQAEIPGARCLDLFAGSGALGFEAASRGAAQVFLVEQQPAACQVLQGNIALLKADHIRLLSVDAMQFLQGPAQPFDVVFVDPPYASDLLAECCQLLEQKQWLAQDASIYIELASGDDLPPLPDNWHIIRGKKAGQVGYYLAKRA